MDAIVTAGGIPAVDDLLYPFTQGQPKALLDIAGKPMIQWVFDALSGAKGIQNLVVIGLPEGSPVVCDKARAYVANQGDMLDNIRAGVNKVLEINPSADDVLLVSSDIPAITSEAVDWVVEETSKSSDDIYYNLITRETMEARFPDSKRSFIRLKGLEVCGADMNVARTAVVEGNEELWRRIVDSRKNVFKQASLIGYDTLIQLLFRTITLEGAVKKVTKRLNVTGQAILCPFAEIGMDVDKPHQLEMLRADLAKRV